MKKINFTPLFDLTISYCFLALLFFVVLNNHSNISIFVVGIIIHSLILHRLGLFIHSFSHKEFSRDGQLNDFLYTLLMGWFFGLNIKNYRIIHSYHHKYHAIDKNLDPENQYSEGIKLKYVFFQFLKKNNILPDKVNIQLSSTFKDKLLRLSALTFHMVLFIFFIINLGFTKAFLFYFIPIFFLLPFLVHLRNTLEHCSFEEGKQITRSFKKSPLSFFLGACGFDRHFEHHQNPSEYYWNLKRSVKPASYLNILFKIFFIKKVKHET